MVGTFFKKRSPQLRALEHWSAPMTARRMPYFSDVGTDDGAVPMSVGRMLLLTA
jgi:hypothetical protein